MELNSTTLLSCLKSLTDAKLIDSLFKDLKGVSSLQKPDKIFLENTNLMYLYQGENVDAGNVRETFLVNQLSYNQTVEFSEISDFFVNGKYTIECGGKSKTGEQIKTLENVGDILTAVFFPLQFRVSRGLLALDVHLPFFVTVQAGQDVQQGRFTAAAFAGDRDKFSRFQFQIHLGETGRHDPFTVIKL